MRLTWNFESSLAEHQSIKKRNFKPIVVQEPNLMFFFFAWIWG